MNRMSFAARPPSTHAKFMSALPFPTAGVPASTDFVRHALFAPQHYEKNYAYPLLVWLHGVGDDESQLPRIMPQISARNYVAVAPGWDATNVHADEHGTSRVEDAVFECIERAAAKYHIARRRVFVAGQGAGGTSALRLALRHPDLLAGALSVGGSFPVNGCPLAGIRRARQVPLWIATGRDSNGYTVDECCHDLRLFHAAGMSVTLRQYPGTDPMCGQMLRDMDVFIMEQVTGVRCEPEDRHAVLFELN